MPAKKSAAELRAENKLLRRTNQAQAITSIANNLIRFGGAVLIARYVYLGIAALAGKTTLTDIGINVAGHAEIGEFLAQALAWIFGGSGVLYGLRQRELRRRSVERLAGPRIEEEKAIDPKRSSSKLTTRGETHPKDKS